MYRETVTVEDAVMAVSVMECSMQVRTKHNVLYNILYYKKNNKLIMTNFPYLSVCYVIFGTVGFL